ncbi:MAG: methyltransferase [Nocardioidaceae bacterium]
MDPVDDVVALVRGAWVALSIRAACELGVMDALEGPLDIDELAERTGSDPAALARLLRVLVDLGLLERDDACWRATSHGEVLRRDHPAGLRSLALMQTVVPNLRAWRHLADGVRRGGAVFEDVHGVTYWDWLSAHPDDEAMFNAAMARRSLLQVAAIEAGHDLTRARLLVDVGGGQGATVGRLLAAHPALHAVVADRPEVAAAAAAALAAAGVGARARGVPTDFFVEVPTGGDVYLLSNVLHDWSDEECVTILRTVRAAMPPDAQLLVVESVLDTTDRSASAQRDLHLVDLHMLVMFGARERTLEEYDALLLQAGFAAAEVPPSPNQWNVLTTRPRP